MTNASNWTAPEHALPPEGVEVNTMKSDGEVSPLVYESGLWFFPDRSMYVYYTPKFWQATS